jgi:folate-binding protein YgfZ
LTAKLTERLEQYVIADDVQLIDVATDYGLLSVQGPKAREVTAKLGVVAELPREPMSFVRIKESGGGEIYVVNQPRLGSVGFDLFVPAARMASYAVRLEAALDGLNGRWAGWQAFEIARVEAGIPRFGADMDETNLPPEAGLDARAISYRKGCYIGQEVIARIRTYGQVARALCRLRLADDLRDLPVKGDVLSHDGKEVGRITSAVRSPESGENLALGYIRREVNAPGTELVLRTAGGESQAVIVSRGAEEKFA